MSTYPNILQPNNIKPNIRLQIPQTESETQNKRATAEVELCTHRATANIAMMMRSPSDYGMHNEVSRPSTGCAAKWGARDVAEFAHEIVARDRLFVF